MGFWQNPLRTFPKVRPKLLPYPLGTLHNTLDSILGVHRPVLGHCFSALASTRWADPEQCFAKTWSWATLVPLALQLPPAHTTSPSTSCIMSYMDSDIQQHTQKMRTLSTFSLTLNM